MDQKNKTTISNAEETRKLRQEFRSIDKDGDGKVDKSEMDFFLKSRGVDEDHRLQIVEELFSKCDEDHSGRIELNEFVDHYVDTKN
jgi:calcium-dependent protein kinase